MIAALLLVTVSAPQLIDPARAGSAGGPAAGPGPDIRLNDPGQEEALQVSLPGESDPMSLCNLQNEVSLARWGDTVVAGWNDGGECDKLYRRRAGVGPSEGISLSGYGFSHDGGATWTDGGVLEADPGTHLTGDPVLAAGPDGTFYYATLVVGQSFRGIGVARSGDGGGTWSIPVIASGPSDPDAEHDKPWLAVDTSASPHRGSVYVAWTEYSGDELNVLLSRSVDGAETFQDPVKLSLVPPGYGSEKPGIGTQIAVGPDGEVHVAWVDYGPRYIWLVTSSDGGRNFSLPREVGDLHEIGHASAGCLPQPRPGLEDPSPEERSVLNGDIRVFNWLSMAVDVSGSPDPASPAHNPYRGTIYIAAPHDPDGNPSLPDVVGTSPHGDESDIVLVYSRDGGATWANVDSTKAHPPVQVILNDDGTETDQFHPQVAVDSEGRVAVSWYDRRVSTPAQPNWDMAVFATVSTDGGQTFGPNLQVSDVPFPPSRTNPNPSGFSGCYMGEYNAMLGGEREFLLGWGDNRDGTPALPDPNVYFDRITLGEGD